MCKEVISQPTLFRLLRDPDGLNFLDENLFLQEPKIRATCWFGPDIPASWIRYEVLLEICSELGKNDEFTQTQLKDLNRLLGVEDSERCEDYEPYDSRLNRLLQLLVDWRDCSETPIVGTLFNALQAVGLMDVVTTLQESLPLFVIKDIDRVEQ